MPSACTWRSPSTCAPISPEDDGADGGLVINTRRRAVRARGPHQIAYTKAMRESDLTFGIGPAGTGKTYLAVAAAVEALASDSVRRIVLVRPAVEAGERLGFLPGDLTQKVDPYLRPMYDALYEMMGFDKVGRLIERHVIEIAPLAFMRGRTLNESFVILDEAQNTTPEQMKMFLTRIGFGSRAVVTGDITQTDLPRGKESGLEASWASSRRSARYRVHSFRRRGRRAPSARAADRVGVRARGRDGRQQARAGMTRRARAVVVTVQNASGAHGVPSPAKCDAGRAAALADDVRGELTVRIVDEKRKRGVERALPRQEGGHERVVVSCGAAAGAPAAKGLLPFGDVVICADGRRARSARARQDARRRIGRTWWSMERCTCRATITRKLATRALWRSANALVSEAGLSRSLFSKIDPNVGRYSP